MADSVKNPEPDFIAGKFADIDHPGVQHQVLPFDTFKQPFFKIPYAIKKKMKSSLGANCKDDTALL